MTSPEPFLLLSCCAPCSCAVIKKLADKGEKFEVVFYNPNIKPMEEYRKRCDENKRVCEKYDIPFTELEYDGEKWDGLTRGLEDEPERGKRCDICFHMRLKRTMEYAKSRGVEAVASVLGISKHKDLQQVNRAARKASEETGIPYLHNWEKTEEMQRLRTELAKELGLYRQNYCGCKPR